jgi:2-polyprenyl-3-methyl-5-hydroxy-6-metoxy-1,4-benzoquinol methylase
VTFSDEREVPYGSFNEVPVDHMARYRFASTYVHDAFVLDAGCGCGYGSYYLSENGAKRVVGIDISDEAVKFAKSHYAKDNLQFERMDATKLLFKSNVFDAVVSFEVIEHVRHYENFVGELSRVLEMGGILIVSTPNKKFSSLPNCETPTWKWHVKEFYSWELEHVLKKYFRQVKILGQQIINQQFLREQERLDMQRGKMLEFIRFVPIQIIRRIPTGMKHLFLGKNPIALQIENIEITDKNVQNARDLVAVCKK